MYHQFNIQQFYVLPTQWIYVFCVDIRTNRHISLYNLPDWFYNIDLRLYRPVVTICTTSLTFNNPTFCPYSEYLWLVWISEQTEIFLYTNLTDWFYNIDLTPYRLVVTICTTRLTLTNSTFCPHCEFLCFLWISLYNFNWLFYNIDLTLYRPVFSVCTTSLTFNISTFCPHIEFFFLCVDLRTNWYISLYISNWLIL